MNNCLRILYLGYHQCRLKPIEYGTQATPKMINDERLKLEAHRALWSAYKRIADTRGVAPEDVVREWTEQQRLKLNVFAAQKDFDELCSVGCSPFCWFALI